MVVGIVLRLKAGTTLAPCWNGHREARAKRAQHPRKTS